MKYQVQENCLTIFLPREVDHHHAEEIRKNADMVIEKNHIKYVIFDFERTEFMDSSGIGAIMGTEMRDTNEMEVIFDSRSENEGFARVAVAAFLTQLNPTGEEVSDVKTAVSEAVTNSIIHGYEGDIRKISIRCRIRENTLIVRIRDEGCGMENVEQAMLPMFTTKPDLDRSGMGFAFMEAFMDRIEVESEPGVGTTVTMEKTIGKGRNIWTTQSI